MHPSLADTLPAPAPPKVCGCGRSYDADAWAALPLVARVLDTVEPFEMRNCECNSTLAVPLCAVHGCELRTMWTVEESLGGYCEAHVREWLMAEREAS